MFGRKNRRAKRNQDTNKQDTENQQLEDPLL